jgi:uncharacterized protein YjbJ (UPF0337 family)
MRVPNNTEMKGKINKAKGAVKEKVGHAVGDRKMEKEGAADRSKGARQESLGRARRKIGDAVKDLGKTIRG